MTGRQEFPFKGQVESENFGAAPPLARAELVAGLSQPTARISPKFFYNALGSKLFEAICQLDEYYLTRAEAEIFDLHEAAIKSAAGAGCTLIDLGAGNCAKAARLFPALRPRQYVPVDISVDFLEQAVGRLRAAHPEIPMQAVGLDFSENFILPAQVRKERRLFFYPGSSIGNFTPLQAAKCLGRLRAAGGADGAVLMGIDLVKDGATLEAAYDDGLGVTAAFNLNALRHVNGILQSDFEVRDWRHKALFNAAHSRIEMYLEARKALTVSWPGGQREFLKGERIHTENSYKYTEERFTDLLAQSGFGETQCWTDARHSFLVCYARAI
jgi:dimethylhistidine N-methyltransferase